MSKQKILLIGGGGHCKSVIDVIELENKYEIYGIVDSDIGEKVLGHEVVGDDDDLPKLFFSCKNAIVTVGQIKSNETRVRLYEKLKSIGFELPIIISPLAYVSKHSHVEEGTVIMHHALINADAKVGKNCIINSRALIEHDAVVGDHCHISTASVINGGVEVKSGTFFGSGAIAKECIKISSNSIVVGGEILKRNI